MATKQVYRFTASRAPWRRAGVKFASVRKPVEIDVAELSDDRLKLLESDPAIRVERVEVESVSDPKGATVAPATGGAAQPLGPTAGDKVAPAADGEAAGKPATLDVTPAAPVAAPPALEAEGEGAPAGVTAPAGASKSQSPPPAPAPPPPAEDAGPAKK